MSAASLPRSSPGIAGTVWPMSSTVLGYRKLAYARYPPTQRRRRTRRPEACEHASYKTCRWRSFGFSVLLAKIVEKFLHSPPVFRFAGAIFVLAQRRGAVHTGNMRNKLSLLLRGRNGEDGLGSRDLLPIFCRSHKDGNRGFGGRIMHGIGSIEVLARRKSEHSGDLLLVFGGKKKNQSCRIAAAPHQDFAIVSRGPCPRQSGFQVLKGVRVVSVMADVAHGFVLLPPQVTAGALIDGEAVEAQFDQSWGDWRVLSAVRASLVEQQNVRLRIAGGRIEVGIDLDTIGGGERNLLLAIHRQRQTDDYDQELKEDSRQPFFREEACFWMIPQRVHSSSPVSHPVPSASQNAARSLR